MIRYVDRVTYAAIVNKLAEANVLMARSCGADLDLAAKIDLQRRAKTLRIEASTMRGGEDVAR